MGKRSREHTAISQGRCRCVAHPDLMPQTGGVRNSLSVAIFTRVKGLYARSHMKPFANNDRALQSPINMDRLTARISSGLDAFEETLLYTEDSNDVTTIIATPRETAVDHVPDIIKTWTETKLQGGKLTAEILAVMITDSQQHDPRILDWISDNTKVTKAEFKKAAASEIRRAKIQTELGRVPGDALDFVKLYAKSKDIECFYSGDMRRSGTPYLVMPDGSKEYLHGEDLQNDMYQIELAGTYYAPINLDTLKRDLRVTASRLKLGLTALEIEDGLYVWHEAQRAERKIALLHQINPFVASPGQRAAAEPLWQVLAEKCFDLSQVGADFVIAALKKFMHQVARKMRGLPVEDHLMLCILGRQGGGKSTFVKKMIEILAECSAETNFKQVEDDRNIDLWSNYILFLDEMGHAARSDMEAIKHAITSSKLTRRPMHSNKTITFTQNATFIGCANKELEQMIKDTTGIRRFLALYFKDNSDWEFINTLDWSILWKSIGAYDECPMRPFREQLKGIQEQSRDRGRVETWMANFAPTDRGFQDGLNKRGRISSHDLYGVFREYEDYAFPGSYKMSKNDWDHEMKRLNNHNPEAMIFEKVRETSGQHYRLKVDVQAFGPPSPPKIVPLRPSHVV